MDNKWDERRSELDRDSLLQSTLSYWSSGAHRRAEPDPMRWEAGRPDFSAVARWAAMLATVGLAVVLLWRFGL